jgi:hypothetical protein
MKEDSLSIGEVEHSISQIKSISINVTENL